MNVYDISLREIGANGRPLFLFFETDVPSIQAMVDRLNAGHLIHGFRLFHRRVEGEPNTREVYDAREEAILLDGIASIKHPRWKLVRYEPEAGA